MERLQNLQGWTWSVPIFEFEKAYSILESYIQENGNPIVPSGYETSNGFKLGGWVAGCRSRFKNGVLPNTFAKKLEAIPGWVWNPYDEKLRIGFEEINNYIKKNGHANVPASFVTKDGYRLGGWVDRYLCITAYTFCHSNNLIAGVLPVRCEA